MKAMPRFEKGLRGHMAALAMLLTAGYGNTIPSIQAGELIPTGPVSHADQSSLDTHVALAQWRGKPLAETQVVAVGGHPLAGQQPGLGNRVAQPANPPSKVAPSARNASPTEAATPSARNVRLAIVPADPSLRAGADLLTAAFSRQPQLELLERSEIDRVFAELALVAALQRDFLKLGQTLGADGLLTLENVREAGTNRLQVTFVAVGPGVVLGSERHPLPREDPENWSALVVSQLAPLIPKLEVDAGQAVPLSIVNLRTAVSTPEALELERELTALLAHRLTREQRLFILERRRMNSLEREKAYEGKERPDFWNGAYLLEGTINSRGVQRDETTLSVRLAPPEGGNDIRFEVAAPRSQLPRLVDELAVQILQTLRQQPRTGVWNPLEEAARYHTEAEWSIRWGMHREAQAAAETAWALGLRTQFMASLRIATYAGEVVTDRSSTVRSGIRERLPFPPNPLMLKPAQRALDLYYMHTKDPPAAGLLDENWGKQGGDLLLRTGQMLEHFHQAPAIWPQVEPDLQTLRQRSRETADAMRSLPALEPHATRVLVALGTYFQETPSDSANLYRELILSGAYRRHVPSAMLVFWRPPEPGGWRADDWLDGPMAWHAFLRELSANGQPAVELEALLWRAAGAESDYDLEEALEQFHAVAWEHRERIISEQIPRSLWDTYDRLAMDIQFNTPRMLSPVRARIRDQLLGPFRQRFDAAKKEFAASAKVSARAAADDSRLALVNELRREFGGKPSMSPHDLFKRFALVAPTEAEAKEILPLALKYQEQLGASAGPANAVILRIRHAAKDPTLVTRRGGSAQPPAATKALAPVSATPAATPNLTPHALTFAAKRFWKLPAPTETGWRRTIEGIIHLAFTDGRLWVQTVFEDSPPYLDAIDPLKYNRRGTAIHIVDPRTLTSEVIEAPRPENPPPRIWMYDDRVMAFSRFVRHGDWLFVRTDDGLLKYDLKGRRWHKAPLGVPEDGMLVSLGKDLFCVSSESILRLNPVTDEIAVLASCRRQPPLTRIDSQPQFIEPVLFRDLDERLCLLLGDDLYVTNPQGTDWERIGQFTGLRPRVPMVSSSESCDLRLLSATAPTVLARWQGSALPHGADLRMGKVMFIKPGEDARPHLMPPALDPVRALFAQEALSIVSGAWDGEDLWAAAGLPRLALRPGQHLHPDQPALVLSYYRSGRGKPTVLVPDLEAPPATALPNLSGSHLLARLAPTFITVSDEFLAVGNWTCPIVWLLPRAELKKHVETATAAANDAQATRPASVNSGNQTSHGRQIEAAFSEPHKPPPGLRKLRRQSKLAPVLGPLPMLKNDAVMVRLGGVALLLTCVAAILGIAFKRTRLTTVLCLAGLAGWAVTGWLY
jgi:hypothetical protein